MMEAARTSETSVDMDLTTRQYIPEDSESHPFCLHVETCLFCKILFILLLAASVTSKFTAVPTHSPQQRQEDFSSGSGAYPASCPMGTWGGGAFPRGKARAGRDADHSPPPSAGA
jgi:hypothetical protein